ncbi:MAG TPA: hypothetical protein VJQ46_05655 [Gemmatimonadales bacterium]|nr:hypothetical protein [Gemmatimonadales bacterium]
MWTARIGWLGLAALLAGCGASRSKPASPAPEQDASAQANAPTREPIRVEIDNQNFSDMNIYLVNEGTHVLLGSVPGMSKTTLSLPPASVSSAWQVRLMADPIGGSNPIRTPTVLVSPGQNVYWTIGSDPANSFVSAG